jgi:hypothetical protein
MMFHVAIASLSGVITMACATSEFPVVCRLLKRSIRGFPTALGRFHPPILVSSWQNGLRVPLTLFPLHQQCTAQSPLIKRVYGYG